MYIYIILYSTISYWPSTNGLICDLEISGDSCWEITCYGDAIKCFTRICNPIVDYEDPQYIGYTPLCPSIWPCVKTESPSNSQYFVNVVFIRIITAYCWVSIANRSNRNNGSHQTRNNWEIYWQSWESMSYFNPAALISVCPVWSVVKHMKQNGSTLVSTHEPQNQSVSHHYH